jgi:hypothetical protein
MWFSHVLLFTDKLLVSWFGLVVVVQNFVSSILNSHLFDFHEGWIYVLGVGVAGGACQAAAKLMPISLDREAKRVGNAMNAAMLLALGTAGAAFVGVVGLVVFLIRLAFASIAS